MNDALVCEPNAARSPIAILGISIDPLTLPGAIERIEQMIASRRPHRVVTANVDFLVQARKDVELRRILLESDVVLCDGTPLVWASRLLGNPLPERVAGADLVPQILPVAARKGYRVFFLGAAPEIAEKAVARLRCLHPDLIIAGHYSPPYGQLLEMNHPEIARRIRDAAPDLLLVSLGCPKQEKWIAMHYRSLGVPVCIGVGATVDFLAGQMKRAPLWMRRSGTEWLFRLAQEPRRLFKRYANDLGAFSLGILAQYWHLKCQRQILRETFRNNSRQAESHWQYWNAPERFDLAAVRGGALPLEKILADPRPCLLNLGGTRFVDSSAVGCLIHLQKKLRAAGGELFLLSPTPRVQRALEVMRLADFFRVIPSHSDALQFLERTRREKNSFVRLRTAAAAGPLLWSGEITAANASAVWEQTENYLLSVRRRELVIDLAEVRFMDSSGIGVMVRAKKAARKLGHKMTFIHLPGAVRNVVRLARLEEFLLGTEKTFSPPEPDISMLVSAQS